MSSLWFFAVAGLTAGGAYALTALGIVVTYRGSGVLNFAQGAIGMAGAFAFWQLHYQHGWAVLPALGVGVVTGAAIGGAVYGCILRFMRDAGDLPRVIVTLGVLLALQGAAFLRYGGQLTSVPPVFHGRGYYVFGALITPDTVVVLGCVIVLTLVISLLFARTRFGIVTTALSENPNAASVLGISPHAAALAAWTLGGALAALAGSLLLPLTGVSPIGLTLIITPALAAGLLGGFRSITAASAMGLAIGVSEALLIKFNISTSLIEALPFVVIVLTLILRGSRLPQQGSLRVRPLPALGSGRPNYLVVGVLTIGAAALALFTSPAWASAVTNSCLGALIALSIVVVTGYAGQISLAPMALAGVSSLVVAQVGQSWHLPFLLALPLGVGTAVVVGVLVGAPALRVRGVNLAIATLGLAVGIESAVFGDLTLTGGVTGLHVSAPTLFGIDLSPGLYPDRFALVALVFVVLVGLAVGNVRRGRSGRRYAAVRANERGAAALGISVSGAKLGAFAVSAGLAGLAGALGTYLYNTATFSAFTVSASILALAFTVFGGIGTVAGAMIAGYMTSGGINSLFASDVLHLTSIDNWLPLITGLIVIDMMVRSPDGITWQAVRIGRRLGLARGPEIGCPLIR